MKRKLARFTAGVIGFLLIGGLLFLTDAFVGNPVSAMIAEKEIDEHVSAAYPGMDLITGKVAYNFKSGEYACEVYSVASRDIVFTVAYKNREIIDRYPSEVGSRFTTFNRLNEKLNRVVQEIVARDFPYETEMVMGNLWDPGQEKLGESLQLDMDLDTENPPLPIQVTAYAYEEDRTGEVLAQRLSELDQVLRANRVHPQYYSLVLVNPEGVYPNEDSLGVYDFSRENLLREDCADILIRQIVDQNMEEK